MVPWPGREQKDSGEPKGTAVPSLSFVPRSCRVQRAALLLQQRLKAPMRTMPYRTEAAAPCQSSHCKGLLTTVLTPATPLSHLLLNFPKVQASLPLPKKGINTPRTRASLAVARAGLC